MRTPLAVAALLCAALISQGCIPLLAVAYDQHRQGELKRERAARMAREDEAYKQAIQEVEAEAARKETEAAEVERTDPRKACYMRAQYRMETCTKRKALQSNSSNPAVRALASGAACEEGFQAAMKICES